MKKAIGITVHYDDQTTLKVPVEGFQVVVGNVAGGSKYTYINADECPIHGPWRAVPAGEKNGKTWSAFWSCDVQKGDPRCTNRPSKEWVETHPPERVLPDTTAEDFDDLAF
jgi:hypothetical protein